MTVAQSGRNAQQDGCSYGRGNRYAIATILLVAALLTTVLMSTMSGATMEIARNRESLIKAREITARVDERLEYMAKTLDEIKAELAKKREAKQ